MQTIATFFTGIMLFFSGFFGGTGEIKNTAVSPPIVVAKTEIISSTSAPDKDQLMQWRTYVNKEKEYQIKYPVDSKLDASNSSCVKIDTKEFGTVYINSGSVDPCGVPTGVGVSSHKVTATTTVVDKQYLFSGFQNNNNAYGFFAGEINSKFSLVYGVEHRNASSVNPEELGSLTEAEYQRALNSAKSILSSFTFVSTSTKDTKDIKTATSFPCENSLDYPSSDYLPSITSLSSISGPVGTVLKVNGCNLTGFEGVRKVTFVSEDGVTFTLNDTTGDFRETKGKLITVMVKVVCQKGEVTYIESSGVNGICNSPKMKPGIYKVYTSPWGKKSNIVTFTVTP